jgi:ubiquinone/menaquinone biosynthesis C-methylase UbiE
VNDRVDYDRIAPTYNRRFAEGEALSPTGRALRTLVDELGVGRMLEVGCGTGHWLASLRPLVGGLYGLDLSAGMLGQARARGAALHLVQGQANQLPYPDAFFDLVTCINAIHHFAQPQAFVTEARRVLRPGGALAVIGMDPHTRPGSWYVYDYFEGTWERDLARFPSWGTVLNWLLAAGFARTAWRPVEEIHDDKAGRAVFDDPFLEKTATSQLALLSDGDYRAGLDRIEAALVKAEASGKILTFPSDIYLSMLAGWTPGRA